MPKKNKKKQKSHLGGHGGFTNTDKPVFDEIVEMYDIKSVLDIGCGPAGMKEIAEAKNVKWYGIDGDPKIIETSNNSLLHDFTLGAPKLDSVFDLAWSVEFLEHVYEEYMDNYMQAFSTANFICCTAAPPGKSGHHHVNCKDLDYWTNCFEQYGYKYDDHYTKKLHSISEMRKDFFKISGMFFFK
jgi:SAM-dependent methyltransferase